MPPPAFIDNPYVVYVDECLQVPGKLGQLIVVQLSLEWANTNEVAVVPLVFPRSVVDDDYLFECVADPPDLFQILDPVLLLSVAVVANCAPGSRPEEPESLKRAEDLRR